jgi:DNA (cytosine-5)-methyltransferase 1
MESVKYNLDLVRSQSNKNLFNVVSLFAGGGGSSLGYRLAGGKVLAINEFIPAAQDAYRRNFPETHIFPGDIRQLTGKEILETLGIKKGELDILDGSPPCSSFSTAGLRHKGWGRIKSYSDSSQRTDDLFFEFVRIINEVQPKVFVAENVKGLTMGTSFELLGSEQLNIFNEQENTIFRSMTNIGYTVRYKVLYAKDYGVPQTRPRVIFIGVRNDILKNNPDLVISYPTRNKEINNLAYCFSDITHTAEELLECDISRFAIGKEALNLHPGEQSNKYFSLIKQSPDSICGTLTQSAGNLSAASVIHWDNRKFSVKESIRIMGFPDDYYLGDKYSQKIERLGRAVSPLMYKYVIENIYKTILSKI